MEYPQRLFTNPVHYIKESTETSLSFGRYFPLMKKEGMIISYCGDRARPVFFRIERVV